MSEIPHYEVLIIGGGTAGITVAASLRRKDKEIEIAIVEPVSDHFYQPAFTLVGAGAYRLSKTRKPVSKLIPDRCTWIVDAAESFDPDKNQVTLNEGTIVSYEYLIICPGLEYKMDRVKGLEQAIGKGSVCTNYISHLASYTWQSIQNIEAGHKVLFTQPPMPIKCPGAPQKIAYLAADYLGNKGDLEKCDLHFMTATPAVFGVPYFARALEKVMKRYGINTHYQTNLVFYNLL